MNPNYHVHILAKQKVDFLQLYRLNSDYYPFLLETVLNNQQQRSFDILFCQPLESIRLDQSFQLHGQQLQETESSKHDFLDAFNQRWLQSRCDEADEESEYPFRGGWFVYLAYELAQQVEPVLKLPPANTHLPIAFACRFQSALIYDHQKNQTVLITECPKDRAKDRVNPLHTQILEQVKGDLQSINSAAQMAEVKFGDVEEDNQQRYLDSVHRVKQYIVDGDVFQVNLSRQWDINIRETEHNLAAARLYARLRQTNPAPFAALASFPKASIISSSPERLLKVSQGIMESRPIAGTRPRSDDLRQDRDYQKQLHQHPKEKAEHIMLIDLIRNDLGRVCQPGSIEANELMVNETYAHVHHIVSNVRGRLRQDILPGDMIRAIFPGGTITGCPKVRCMEIIAEQEQVARNAYTGSLGYINNDGSMDLNILIRTMILDEREDKQQLSFRAGAGLVADSEPHHELNETRAKALGLLKVFQ